MKDRIFLFLRGLGSALPLLAFLYARRLTPLLAAGEVQQILGSPRHFSPFPLELALLWTSQRLAWVLLGALVLTWTGLWSRTPVRDGLQAGAFLFALIAGSPLLRAGAVATLLALEGGVWTALAPLALTLPALDPVRGRLGMELLAFLLLAGGQEGRRGAFRPLAGLGILILRFDSLPFLLHLTLQGGLGLYLVYLLRRQLQGHARPPLLWLWSAWSLLLPGPAGREGALLWALAALLAAPEDPAKPSRGRTWRAAWLPGSVEFLALWRTASAALSAGAFLPLLGLALTWGLGLLDGLGAQDAPAFRWPDRIAFLAALLLPLWPLGPQALTAEGTIWAWADTSWVLLTLLAVLALRLPLRPSVPWPAPDLARETFAWMLFPPPQLPFLNQSFWGRWEDRISWLWEGPWMGASLGLFALLLLAILIR